MKKSCKNFIPRFAIEGFADLEVHCPIGTDQLIGRRPIHQRARHRSPKNGSRTILPQFSDETLEETRKMNLIAVLFKLISLSLSLSRTRLCAWSPKTEINYISLKSVARVRTQLTESCMRECRIGRWFEKNTKFVGWDLIWAKLIINNSKFC